MPNLAPIKTLSQKHQTPHCVGEIGPKRDKQEALSSWVA